MFYVYSDYTGDGEHVETEKEAIQIAKKMIANEIVDTGQGEESIAIDIYKAHLTVTAISSITYNVEEIKSDGN